MIAQQIADAGAADVLYTFAAHAIFHVNQRTTVTGTLVKVDWINPHIVMLVDGQGRDGAVEHWKFQSNPPAWWRAVGVNRADMAKGLGQQVVVDAQPAQDGSRYGYLRKITFANGDSLEAVTTASAEPANRRGREFGCITRARPNARSGEGELAP